MIEEQTLRGRRRSLRRLALLPAVALFGVLAASTAASAADQPAGQNDDTREYTVPVNQPEGVVYDNRTQAFYGGSSLSGDGTVYKATLHGQNLDGPAQVFMPPGFDGAGNPDDRTQTHGFNVDNQDRLYIAGVTTGKLHVYQLPEGNKIAEFNTGAGGYINDVAISPRNGDVYFTDSQRPFIYRVTREQVEAGGGAPQAIPLEPEVDYGPSGRTNNKLEANGIRFTPGGKYIIFDSLNNGQLYRMTPPPPDNPAARRIDPITGVTPAQLGNADGLEFKDGHTLYSVDNSSTINQTPGSFDESPERIVTLKLSGDYLTATLVGQTTNPEFHTPTAASLAPADRLLVNNAEFFNTDRPPYDVLSIPRP